MLIEIHMIQNHSPANLNRDDLGAPKTCVFGGVTRARISSQCLKRSIRRSTAFQAALERDGGVRTRRLITILAEQVHGGENPPRDLVDFIAGAFHKGGIERTGKGEEPDNTNILLFIPQSAIAEMVDAVKGESRRSAAAQKSLAEGFADILGRAACVPDIALSGRMIELDQKGLFAKMNLGVNAALSVAHAISTHEVTNEVDYFTAVDDLATGPGAAHVDEAQFASACFYKYFCLDWNQLVRNVSEAGEDAEKLAAATLGHFLMAAATANPSGKQKSFAAHNLPDGILVEIKTETKTPTSYANAFADPVPAKSERGLVRQSIAQLGQYVHDVSEGYGLQAERYWFSPAGRYSLTWVDRSAEKEYEKEKKVLEEEAHNLGCLDELVKRVINAAIGKDWDDVKDAGKKGMEANS